MQDWQQGDISSNGIRIHYYRTGGVDKPPLILAHGFTDNGLCWTRTAEALMSEFDVVMVDARNHGLSGAGPADVGSLAADLAIVRYPSMLWRYWNWATGRRLPSACYARVCLFVQILHETPL